MNTELALHDVAPTTSPSDGDRLINTALILYDTMCRAIDECLAVDEVLALKDKALALEAYAKQLKNIDAERKAAEVRLRAERRTGELVAELDRTKIPNPEGKNQHEVTSSAMTQPPSPYAKALLDNNISRQEANRYEALSKIPSGDFEDLMADPSRKPTTRGMLREWKAKEKKEVLTPTEKRAATMARKDAESKLWLQVWKHADRLITLLVKVTDITGHQHAYKLKELSDLMREKGIQ